MFDLDEVADLFQRKLPGLISPQASGGKVSFSKLQVLKYKPSNCCVTAVGGVQHGRGCLAQRRLQSAGANLCISKCHPFYPHSRLTEDSNRNGISNMLVEAMVTGLLVITTGVAEIPELVKNDQNGFLYPPHDVELRAFLQGLLNCCATQVAASGWVLQPRKRLRAV